VLTPVDGAVTLDASGWVASASAGETVIIPTEQTATLSAQTDSVLLRGWVPDLEREIITPARAAGASDAAICSLGVPMDNSVDDFSHGAREPGERF
jgi:hypothetical protein